MTTIKEAYNKLSEQEQAQLLYALEHGLTQHLEFPNGTYIGVNVSGRVQNLKPFLESGSWSIGTVTKEKQSDS